MVQLDDSEGSDGEPRSMQHVQYQGDDDDVYNDRPTRRRPSTRRQMTRARAQPTALYGGVRTPYYEGYERQESGRPNSWFKEDGGDYEEEGGPRYEEGEPLNAGYPDEQSDGEGLYGYRTRHHMRAHHRGHGRHSYRQYGGGEDSMDTEDRVRAARAYGNFEDSRGEDSREDDDYMRDRAQRQREQWEEERPEQFQSAGHGFWTMLKGAGAAVAKYLS